MHRQANSVKVLPGLIYQPEGDAIIVRNGTRWDNRPLYCNGREMVVYAGEMPGLSCKLGKLRVAVRRGTMLESMYGDPDPKAGYSHEQKQNYISPGGLSQPCCAIDFADITSMFCRTVVEGLFGYRPDYPNGAVTVAPGLPSAWDHASIRTPDYTLVFKRDGDIDRYVVGLARPVKMRWRLPIRAETVKSVTINGAKAQWTIEPWVGCGMLLLEVPESVKAEIEIKLSARVSQVQAMALEKKVGETCKVAGAIDPQGCLGAAATPGQHMAFANVERGNVPYLQVYKVTVCGSTNPMQGRIANAVLRFRYADGQEERFELVPPLNFWSLCGFGRTDYDLKRDAFVLPKNPPPQVQLGENCRAMVYGWRLRPGIVLKDVVLEALSEEVVIGLMGVSVMNPK